MIMALVPRTVMVIGMVGVVVVAAVMLMTRMIVGEGISAGDGMSDSIGDSGGDPDGDSDGYENECIG